MKVTIDRKDQETDKPFPKLMVSNIGTVVYFYNTELGGEVHKNGIELAEVFNSTKFKDFPGTITLEND